LRSDDRRAFFAYASRVMRSVIIDAVRERQAERRGGDLQRTTLDTVISDSLPSGEEEALEVHEALHTLADADPRLAKVVEMRLGISEERDRCFRHRDWRFRERDRSFRCRDRRAVIGFLNGADRIDGRC
jgi:hypothetical protein